MSKPEQKPLTETANKSLSPADLFEKYATDEQRQRIKEAIRNTPPFPLTSSEPAAKSKLSL